MQWKYLALASSRNRIAGSQQSDSDSMRAEPDGGAARSGQLLDAAAEAAGAPAQPAMRFDEGLERSRCLASSIRDCTENSFCEVHVLGAQYPGCPGANVPAFCGLRRTTCGLAIWCAVDHRGVVWGSGDTCGMREALQLGWHLQKACMPGTAEDDAGAPIEEIRPEICSTPTTPDPPATPAQP